MLYDGRLAGLVERFAAYRQIGVTLAEPAELGAYGEVTGVDGAKVTLRVPKAEASRVTARLLAELAVEDLTIEEPPIDDVIERVFAADAASALEPQPS